MKAKTAVIVSAWILSAVAVLYFFYETPTPSVSGQTANANIAQKVKKNVPRPTIVSRDDWKAKAPKGEGKTHEIKFITVHHTATAQKKTTSIEKKLQGLQNFSQTESKLASGKLKPVWFDVPYHFYIAADGQIAEGREIEFAGDTNTDYDPTGHALVVVEGNFETEQPTAEQLKSLENLVAWLASEYKVSTDAIKAHNDYVSTACPGKNLKKLLPDLRAAQNRRQ